MTLRILGIDPSLRSTGLCVLNDTIVQQTHTIQTHDMRGMMRLGYIANMIRAFLACKPDVIVIEGYAMGVKGSRVFDIGEMGYAIKKVLYDSGIETWIVAPTSMKKFVTGKGTSNKRVIQDALLTTWDIDITQEDEADACGLALFGYYFKHRREQRRLTESQRDALQFAELLNY